MSCHSSEALKVRTSPFGVLLSDGYSPETQAWPRSERSPASERIPVRANKLGRRTFLGMLAVGAAHAVLRPRRLLTAAPAVTVPEPGAIPRGIVIARHRTAQTMVTNHEAVQFGAPQQIALKFVEPLGFYRIDPQTKVATELASATDFRTSRIRLSPNGRYLGSVSLEGVLSLRDLVTGELFVRDKGLGWVADLSWAPDSTHLLVAGKTPTERPGYEVELQRVVGNAGKMTLEQVSVTSHVPLWYRAPVFSSDGQWLAYHSVWGKVSFGRAAYRTPFTSTLCTTQRSRAGSSTHRNGRPKGIKS